MRYWPYIRNPAEAIRVLWLLWSGLRLFRYNPIKLWRHIPRHINSMGTAWNLRNEPHHRDPSTIIDAGANDSQMIELLVEGKPMPRIISIEPNPNCRPLGEVHRVALSNENRLDSFWVPNGDTPLGRIGKGDGGDGYRIPAVTILRFDDLAEMNSSLRDWRRPCLVKVDVEGHEFEALQGFGDYLWRVDALLIEIVNGENLGGIANLLRGYGITRHTIMYAAQHAVCPPIYCDVYFWRP